MIDRFDNGVATSIKSMDLSAPGYQNTNVLTGKLNGYVDSLAMWRGQTTPYGGVAIEPGRVTAKVMQLAVPGGNITAAQQGVINEVSQRAQSLGVPVIVTPVP